MKPGDVVRLVALAAIWGASFLFVRIVAPALGPFATADSRMLVAGVALLIWLRIIGFDPQWRRWGRHYAGAGMINTGAPFILYAYAALHITAGELAVLNATSPMWGAVMGAAFLGERLTARRVVGLVLGIAGVALLARPAGGNVSFTAIAAGLAAAACYGFIGVYLHRWAPGAPAKGMAVGTQLLSGIIVLPLAIAWPPAAAPSLPIVICVIALGLVCGAIAYVLYFRLIVDVGATAALTVTYLIPFFAMMWGALFLGEPVTLVMLGGAALVIVGTVLVVRG